MTYDYRVVRVHTDAETDLPMIELWKADESQGRVRLIGDEWAKLCEQDEVEITVKKLKPKEETNS